VKVGDKKYDTKSSECWMIFPAMKLTIETWTYSENTYLITAPVSLADPVTLINSKFKSEFSIAEIDDIDSTLMVDGQSLDVWNQKVAFDCVRLFEVNHLNITGLTSNNEKVEISSTCSFNGFEIWKQDDYQQTVKQLEQILNELSIRFEKYDEVENELIRIKIKTTPNTH
jgi:hypothetical protein